jgi:hypothetical protein
MEILQAQAGLSRLTIFYCILLTLRESIVRQCGFENELPAHLRQLQQWAVRPVLDRFREGYYSETKFD